MEKKAESKLSMGVISALLMTIIVIIIIFQALTDTADDVGYAADNISTARLNADYSYEGADVLPLTSFMKKKGIVLLTLMAGLVIVIITGVFKFGKK